MGIYLDYASTTRMSQRAQSEYLRVANSYIGNPQGNHRFSREALAELDNARERVAVVLGVSPSEIYFTGSATEANNIALNLEGKILTSAIEHKAVLAPAMARKANIFSVTSDGTIDRDLLRQLLKESGEELKLVSFMAVNNEIGVVNPVAILGGMVKKYTSALFHCDAVQAANYFDLRAMVVNCDMLSLSAHKFGGPKGVGILYIREGVKVKPLMLGGAQERDIRPGTTNLAGAVSASVAFEDASRSTDNSYLAVQKLRDQFEDGVLASDNRIFATIDRNAPRSPAISNLLFPGTVNEEMLFLLDSMGVAASGGAACASGALDPSHVILALGYEPKMARSALRFSFSTTTTAAEVDEAIEIVLHAYRKLVPIGSGVES